LPNLEDYNTGWCRRIYVTKYYFPPFKAASAGVRTFMNSFNELIDSSNR
jgi:hypothetical protein